MLVISGVFSLRIQQYHSNFSAKRQRFSYVQPVKSRCQGNCCIHVTLPLPFPSAHGTKSALRFFFPGDVSVALEALLGQMAVAGHGRETLQNASRHLENLKAKGKKVRAVVLHLCYSGCRLLQIRSENDGLPERSVDAGTSITS